MKKLLVATRNRGKLKEIRAILDGLVDEVLCADEIPGLPETVEDGKTFTENALKKAREASHFSKLPVLADDSGLVVDAIGGAPGVYSARFAGEGAGDGANNAKLLSEIKSIPLDNREAAFVCVMAFVSPDGTEQTFSGRIAGKITEETRGDNGFGYDPIFLVDGFNRTMAELSIDEKNRISHRGQALMQFRSFLEGSKKV